MPSRWVGYSALGSHLQRQRSLMVVMMLPRRSLDVMGWERMGNRKRRWPAGRYEGGPSRIPRRLGVLGRCGGPAAGVRMRSARSVPPPTVLPACRLGQEALRVPKMDRLRQVELLKRAKLKRVLQKIDRWTILQGDEVMVTSGKEKGRTGIVKEVVRKTNQVKVEGLNLTDSANNWAGLGFQISKSVKSQLPDGSVQVHQLTREGGVHVSNVSLLDPITRKPVRVSMRFLENGEKVRISKGKFASGAVIPKPPIQRRSPSPYTMGPKDTPIAEALKVTYVPPSFAQSSYSTLVDSQLRALREH
eukprot:scaffold215_cov423-Prasinococcus_capsulatus_cf.AAC.2